ncbi:hypothetical protein FJ959_22235 [Mesorhizobium sp. B2-2-4]|uniref:hypothetical protein n=2 Tax=Mesorhizobium TaxID=68287 RepID=UPI00112961B1|nr:hypothetical protein [Mesorhizobium sp. B2-2-4]TPM53253.1 hypothetical protein FJ959_22235 [Mesorhizobium sp. B2-2-4]TPN68476.1 hypothetical protein FJ984_11615 [Mesorhizobium sp. B1-1-3]
MTMRKSLRLAFSRDTVDPAIAKAIAEDVSALKPEGIMERAGRAVSSALTKLRDSEVRLEAEIAERSEELRQVRIVIQSQQAAEQVLNAAQ